MLVEEAPAVGGCVRGLVIRFANGLALVRVDGEGRQLLSKDVAPDIGGQVPGLVAISLALEGVARGPGRQVARCAVGDEGTPTLRDGAGMLGDGAVTVIPVVFGRRGKATFALEVGHYS